MNMKEPENFGEQETVLSMLSYKSIPNPSELYASLWEIKKQGQFRTSEFIFSTFTL